MVIFVCMYVYIYIYVCVCVCVNTVANSVLLQLYLQHDLNNYFFLKIKHKLHVVPSTDTLPPISEKLWVRTSSKECDEYDCHNITL